MRINTRRHLSVESKIWALTKYTGTSLWITWEREKQFRKFPKSMLDSFRKIRLLIHPLPQLISRKSLYNHTFESIIPSLVITPVQNHHEQNSNNSKIFSMLSIDSLKKINELDTWWPISKMLFHWGGGAQWANSGSWSNFVWITL